VPLYALERIAALCSHAELVQNPEDLETLASIGVSRRKLKLLGNGVDLTRFDPAAVEPGAGAAVRAEVGAGADDVVVGVVARLVWEKGYREVFDAATRLRTEAPSTRVVVVGGEEPDKGDAVGPAAKAKAAAGGVTFLGHREDMTALYSAFDVYVLASHREGFPRSAMEAAAMGLPLVVTDIRGCREVVDDDQNGLVVPVRDAAALAAAIARLAGDAALRRSFGEAGRAKALREFDDRRVIDITLSTYASLRG
jgi:glycosyltransferase involved in cell wall biosynthesis